eukprot:3768042-Karenia_brevis.AAC.1
MAASGDMKASDEETIKAMSCTSTARMVQKEFDIIRMAHLTGAATEFQIQKVWEFLQHLALKHNFFRADELEASHKLQAIVQRLGDEIDALGQLPQGKSSTGAWRPYGCKRTPHIERS